MTQAFNLAQLANNLNTSGQLDATDGLNGLVANANLASSGSASSSTYLRGDRTWASLPALGKVLQVVSAAKTDTFTFTNTIQTGGVQIPGLTVTLTPSSTSSRFFVTADLTGSGTSGVAQVFFRLYRNSTNIISAPDDGSRIGSTTRFYFADANVTISTGLNYVDSPNTTSPVTYSIYVGVDAATGYINRNQGDLNNPIGGRTVSVITAFEIGA